MVVNSQWFLLPHKIQSKRIQHTKNQEDPKLNKKDNQKMSHEDDRAITIIWQDFKVAIINMLQ